MHKKIVGVIGGHRCNKEVEQLAHNLGKKLAKVVDYLVCGGLSGVMEAACRGFKESGGVTIGIITSSNKKDANPYVDIVIPTGFGLARNVLVVQTADVIIALPGEHGTLSEIAYALQYKKPIIGIKTWDIDGIIKVKTLQGVVEALKKQLLK